MPTLTSPTQERLIREVRTILKQPRAENSRWSDMELGQYLNDAISQYFLIINEVAEGQFDKKTTLNLVSGTETVALPSDFFSLKALYKHQNNQDVILNYDNQILDSRSTANDSTGSDSYQPSYYFRAQNLVLNPIPGFSETGGLVIEYTAFPDTILFGTDSLTAGIAPVFKELVVMYSVFKAKMADDLHSGTQTAAPAQAHLGVLYENFRTQVSERSKYPLFVKAFNP